MRTVFFGASLPLTKTLACQNGQFSVSPYPHVSRLTSYQEEVNTLAQFETALREHGKAGHCLFNGQLKHPLDAESRAGKTLKGAPREWVVFDFDKVEAKDHADVVRRFLPDACQNVSYVVQHSASMWRPDAKRWSGHIFMLLKDASNETTLREWFEHINFTVAALKSQIVLTDSGLGLHWPLDRSAAYDSKLIYIAPPRVHGFKPAFDPSTAIQLVKKKQPALKLPTFQPISRSTIEAEVNARRQAVGLDPLGFRTRPFEDGEVLLDVDRGVITDVKPMGDHYIKFNLNGGDSLGYWIDLRNPTVIKNFKGEPWVMTQDIDPDFYKKLAREAPRVVSKPPLDEGTEVLAFYATNQNSKVLIGTFNAAGPSLVLNRSTETAARSWLAEWGVVGQNRLPHMDLHFDPTNDIQFVPGSTTINTFTPTPYMRLEPSSKKKSTTKELPPLINRLLRSVLGNPTEDVLAHFINWLAYIFQKREKTGTAWVLTGRTGTGKGSLVKYIIRPLFGGGNVKNAQYTALNNEFNGYLENSLFVVFEECDTHAVANTAELQTKIRHYITDSPILIRRMQTDHYEAPNYSNFLFMANTRAPTIITSDDRRMNVANRQEQQIFFTPNELLTLQNGTELEAMADVLARWPVDEMAAHRIIETEARADMHEATTPINQLIADAIKAGDLEFFLDRTPSDAEAQADYFGRFNPIGLYKAFVDRALHAARTKQSMLVKEDELYILFRTLIPNPKYFEDSKTWRKRHYKALGLDVDKVVRVPGAWDSKARGLLVKWELPEGYEDNEPAAKVVPINRGKGGRK